MTDKKEGAGFVMQDAKSSAAPQIDFSTLALSLATSALVNLGLAKDPTTGKTQVNPELAKQNIDILAMLQEKTKNNLTADESKLLESLLTETRLRFVEVTRK